MLPPQMNDDNSQQKGIKFALSQEPFSVPQKAGTDLLTSPQVSHAL